MIRRLRLAGVSMVEIGQRCQPPITRQRVLQIWEAHASARDWQLLAELKDDRAQTVVDEMAHRAGTRQKIAARARARVITDMQEWHRLFGQPPAANDWIRSRRRTARVIARYESTGRTWPNAGTVQYLFGSWNAAIQAAGFEPKAPGHRRGWSATS